MARFFSERIAISRQRLEFVYSIFVLLLIPVLIVVNTLLITNRLQDSYDRELRSKADIANTILASFVRDVSSEEDIALLQESINKLSEQDSIENITVAIPRVTQYEVIAAQDESLVGQQFNNLQYSLAVDSKQAIAQLVQTSGARAWSVTSPTLSDSGEVTSLVSIDVRLDDADDSIAAALRTSFWLVLGTVILVVLLLVNHFRFVEYARLFRKLKEVDQMKSDFLNVATHELKAPMAIIEGGLSNMIDGVHGDVGATIREKLGDMRSQTKRLGGLVEDLLNVSRLEQGKISFEIQPMTPAQIIQPIIERYQPMAKEKGIALSYIAEGAAKAQILADEGRFQEIMINLIDNAVKYSETGTITITQSASPTHAIFKVRDTGIGLSADERKHLFQRFYRAQNNKTAKIAGTGLGLWIIKQYIERMNGTIDVDSLEGSGTEFSVSLPLVK